MLPAAEHSPLRMNSKKKTSWRGYSSLLFTSTGVDENDGHDEGNSRTMELSNRPPRHVTLRGNDSSDDDDDYVLPGLPENDDNRDDHHDSLQPPPHSPQSSIPDNTSLLDIEEAIDRLGMGKFQYLIVLACGLCFAADAMEVLLLSFLAVILQAEWGLSEGQVDSIISVVFAGAMLGTLVLSTLGDWWGRRPVFGLTAALISIFGVATAFCTTYEQVVVARFLVGFGVGGLTVPYDALSEFMPTSYRGTNLLSTSFFWTGGSLLVPFFAWLTLGGGGGRASSGGSWRAFVTLCALPCIVSTVLGIFLVPESPRWLLTRGKEEKAMRILRQGAAQNGRDPYLTFPAGTKLIDHAAAKEAKVDAQDDDENQDGKDGIISKSHQPHHAKEHANCWMLCSNPQWRKMIALLSGQWYGLAFMYYGAIMAVSIVFSDESSDTGGSTGTDATSNPSADSDGGEYAFDYTAILISSSAEVIGLTIAILTVDRFGRVPTQVCTYFFGGLCILILGLLDFYVGGDVADQVMQESASEGTEEFVPTEQEEQQEERRHLIFFAFLSRMFIMAATSLTWLHTSELLPTEIRATGHGFANAMGRIGGITCPFIISESTSLRTIGIVMFLVSTTTAFFSHCLPETAGKALGDFETDAGITVIKQKTESAAAGDHAEVAEEDSVEADDVDTEKDASSFELL